MGRFIIVSVLLALGALSAPVAAQTAKRDSIIKVPTNNAIGFGYFATLGSYWQIESVEFGYVRKLTRGFAAISLTARLGTFIDETAVSGGSRGIAFAPTLGLRTKMKRIAQLGEDDRGTAIGLDMTFETSAYLASGSPFWQGSRWGAVAVLPGLRIGKAAIVIGPTAFFGGSKPVVRGVLSFRAEATLARRERQP